MKSIHVLNQKDLTSIVQSYIRVQFPEYAAPYSHEISVVFDGDSGEGKLKATVEVQFYRPEEGIVEAAPGTVGSRDVTIP